MQPKRNPKNLQILDLSALKLEVKTTQKEVEDNQKVINKSINSFGKQIPLPKKSEQRYNEKFGKEKERTAIRIILILFIITFIGLLFFQPSIFFTSSDKETKLVNFSAREITNIKVYSLNNLLDLFGFWNTPPIVQKAILNGKGEFVIQSNKTAVLIALADRQLPAIGTILVPEDYSKSDTINSSNDANNSGFFPGLKAEMPKSDVND